MNGPFILVIVASQTQGLHLKLLLEEQGIDAACVADMAAATVELAARQIDLLMVDAGTVGPEGMESLRQSGVPVMPLGREQGNHDPVDPLAVVHEAIVTLDRQAEPPGEAEIFGRARILIVDDSATYREFLRAELELEGCHVTTARNADEAVTALSGDRFDCVILDLVMPGTSGTQLCERLDRFRRRRGLFFQTIILTSQDGEEQLKLSLSAGADDFVGKGQSMDALKIRLMALLRRKYFVEDHLLRGRRPQPSA